MRRETELTLTDRGKELRFRIKEMPATKLEAWIGRAMIALGPVLGKRTGEGAGLAEATTESILGGALENLDYDKAKPLWDELLECCWRVVEGGADVKCEPHKIDGFMEDVTTLFKLKAEALKLNLGFLGEGGLTGFLGKPPSGPPAGAAGP